MENPMVPIRPDESSLERASFQKEKQTRPDVKPINQRGKVVEKKPSLARKAASTFLAEDIENVKEFIIFDVVVPGIKEAFLSSMEMLLWGSTRRGGYRRNDSRSNERVSYNTYYRSSRDDRSDRRRDTNRDSASDFRDLVFTDRRDAEDIVNEIKERIIEYGDASLADMYQACKLKYSHTDMNWGWQQGQEDDIYVRQVRGGYKIEVPKLRMLD